jgi:hypothetical protein
LTKQQKSGVEPTLRLYNIIQDPTESTNLALLISSDVNRTAHQNELISIIQIIEERLKTIHENKPPTQLVWMQMKLELWVNTFVSGDCSTNPQIKPAECIFTHPWISDVR